MGAEALIRVAFLIGMTALGYGVGRRLQIQGRELASLLIHVIVPTVIFLTIQQSPAGWGHFGFAGLTWALASLLGLSAWALGRHLWLDARANLFGFAGGTSNTGYFGLPLVFALFPAEQAAVAVFIILGINLYEFSVGYFVAARGVMGVRESLRRVVRLPVLYAALAGLLCKSAGLVLPSPLVASLEGFKGAYSVLGMMVIGLSLASFRPLRVDGRLLLALLGWKHLVWPLAGWLLFGVLWPLPSEWLALVMMMMSTPMAANVAVIARSLDVHPDKAALAVMASTLLALVTVPLVLAGVQ